MEMLVNEGEVDDAQTSRPHRLHAGGVVERGRRRDGPVGRPLAWDLESQSCEVQIRSRSAAQSQTVKYEPWDGGLKRTIDRVDAQGQAFHNETIAKFDGKAYPVQGGQSPRTLAYKRIDDRTFENFVKVNGEMILTTRWVVSRDGKTATVTQTGKNAQGQAVNITEVVDRQ
jgi:hypothetical protein